MDERVQGQIDRRAVIRELPPPSAFDPRPQRFNRTFAIVGTSSVVLGAIVHRLVLSSPDLSERLLAMAQQLMESLA